MGKASAHCSFPNSFLVFFTKVVVKTSYFGYYCQNSKKIKKNSRNKVSLASCDIIEDLILKEIHFNISGGGCLTDGPGGGERTATLRDDVTSVLQSDWLKFNT